MTKKEIEKALKNATNSNKSKLPKKVNKTPKKASTKKHITVVEVSPGVFIEERRLSKK